MTSVLDCTTCKCSIMYFYVSAHNLAMWTLEWGLSIFWSLMILQTVVICNVHWLFNICTWHYLIQPFWMLALWLPAQGHIPIFSGLDSRMTSSQCMTGSSTKSNTHPPHCKWSKGLSPISQLLLCPTCNVISWTIWMVAIAPWDHAYNVDQYCDTHIPISYAIIQAPATAVYLPYTTLMFCFVV